MFNEVDYFAGTANIEDGGKKLLDDVYDLNVFSDITYGEGKSQVDKSVYDNGQVLEFNADNDPWNSPGKKSAGGDLKNCQSKADKVPQSKGDAGDKQKSTPGLKKGDKTSGRDSSHLTDKQLTDLDIEMARQGAETSKRRWLAHMTALCELQIGEAFRDWIPDAKIERSVAAIFKGGADPGNHKEVAEALLKRFPKPEDWDKYKKAEIKSQFEKHREDKGLKKVDLNDPSVKKFLKKVDTIDKFIRQARKKYKGRSN